MTDLCMGFVLEENSMTIKEINGERTIERSEDVLKAIDALIEYCLTLPISDEARYRLYEFVGTAITEAEQGVMYGFLAHIESLADESEVTKCQEETPTS